MLPYKFYVHYFFNQEFLRLFVFDACKISGCHFGLISEFPAVVLRSTPRLPSFDQLIAHLSSQVKPRRLSRDLATSKFGLDLRYGRQEDFVQSPAFLGLLPEMNVNTADVKSISLITPDFCQACE